MDRSIEHRVLKLYWVLSLYQHLNMFKLELQNLNMSETGEILTRQDNDRIWHLVTRGGNIN